MAGPIAGNRAHEHDAATTVVWGSKASFRITEKSVEDLKSDRLPKDLIEKLEPIKNEEFEDEATFTAALNRTLGAERAAQYHDLISSYALAAQESQSFHIGEEKAMSFPQDFQNAAITYRDLETTYQIQSLDDLAAEFNFRENEVITQGAPWPLRIFRILFYKWTYEYGSRPLWLLWYSLGVIGIFTVVFALLTLSPKIQSGIYIVRGAAVETTDEQEAAAQRMRLPFGKGRVFFECFYFSLLSFTTCGFDILQPRQWLEFFRLKPVRYEPVGWARILVGIEAALGIYVLALLSEEFFSILLG